MHVVSNKMINVKLIGKPTGKLIKPASALDERHVKECVQDVPIKLENIKAEGFRLATGAHRGTQFIQPIRMNTQPSAAQRQRQDQTQGPSIATSPIEPLYFVGESEDWPPPPQRQYSQTSVVDGGGQSRQASTPAANCPIAAPTITQTQPLHNNSTAASTVSSSTAALQQLIQNVVEQGASFSQSTPPDANQVIPTPLDLEWGLPDPNQIPSDGINHWICLV